MNKYLILIGLLLCAPTWAWAEGTLTGVAMPNTGGYLRAIATGDVLVKTGTGFLHSYVCWGNDAAATAGDIAFRDGVAAGGGTVMIDYLVPAAALIPTAQTPDVPFSVGLFIDYTTTADVTCTVSYR